MKPHGQRDIEGQFHGYSYHLFQGVSGMNCRIAVVKVEGMAVAIVFGIVMVATAPAGVAMDDAAAP